MAHVRLSPRSITCEGYGEKMGLPDGYRTSAGLGYNQDRFLEASGGVAAASENRFGDPASMVERADAEDEALLRPVTTLGESFR